MAVRANLWAVLILVAGSCFGQLNIRYLTATTALAKAEVPSSVMLRWYQGESLVFDHWSTASGTNAADWSGQTNLTAIWSIVADRSDDPGNSNVYLWATGTIYAATGRVRFTVPPQWAAMPASNYWSFITLFQTDGSGVTNTSVGVVHRSMAHVQQRDTGTSYVGPWQIPSNMVDAVARARADAAYVLAAAGSSDTAARSGVLAVSGRVDVVEAWGDHSTNLYLKPDENEDVTFPRRIVLGSNATDDPETMKGIFWNNANGTWVISMGPTNILRLANEPAHPNLHNDIFEMDFRYLRWAGETRSSWPSVVSPGTWRNPEWFNLVWALSPTSCPDSTTYRTNLDQVLERQGFNNVRYDRVAQISDQHSFFDLDFTVEPAERASVSSNGYLTHLADGVVTAAVTAATFGRTNVLVMRTEGMAIDRYWDGAEGSLRAAIISNVAAGVGTTGATMRTFSAYNTNGTAFTRSTNLWIRPAPECVAAWNSRAQPYYGGGVLITPRHAITAAHASFRPQVGDTVKWVDSTNGVWTAVVDAEVLVAADIAMIRLDTEIPVPVAKVLANPAAALPTGIREIPLACGEVHFGAHEFQLVVGGSEGWNERGYTGISWWKAAERIAWRALFRHYPVSGDSSQPVLFSTGMDFVLLFCLYYPTSGPSVHSYLEEIQAAIAAWGDPETLSYLDVTPYTEF